MSDAAISAHAGLSNRFSTIALPLIIFPLPIALSPRRASSHHGCSGYSGASPVADNAIPDSPCHRRRRREPIFIAAFQDAFCTFCLPRFYEEWRPCAAPIILEDADTAAAASDLAAFSRAGSRRVAGSRRSRWPDWATLSAALINSFTFHGYAAG